MPKFTMYDGTSDPFDHLMHFQQVMTLDERNDPLMCKVFLSSLHGRALFWLHTLARSSIILLKDLSEIFVTRYLCYA